jgi:hypothetical protein
MQDQYLTGFRGSNLSSYRERVDSLDLRVEYRFPLLGSELRAYFEGSDLLKGPHEPDFEESVGGAGITPKTYINANYIGGRVLRLGLIGTF